MTHLEKELPLIRGIDSEIRELLTNLVFNAVDAMPEGGLLTVRTTSASEAGVPPPGGKLRQLVSLEVTDSGIGMNEETRRRCIEPFFTTKGEHGSGLGLPMVFSVAQRHDADVEIDSAPGVGTTVRLVFLAAAGEESTAAIPEKVPAAENLFILVVDDDPILLETLCDVLEGDGHQVLAAGGGAAGIEAFKKAYRSERVFDLVITDLGMPEIDGRRVAEAIKERSPTTPVMLLTGWGHRMLLGGEKPPQVDLLLSKPPRLQELRSAIRRLHGR